MYFLSLSSHWRRPLLLLGFASLLIALGPAHSQTPGHQLTLEAAAERKSEIQAQIKELDQSGLSDEELESAKNRLGQLLTALTAFEEAIQRRDAFKGQLDNLPRRLEEVLATRDQLENRPPAHFPAITEALRAEIEAKRQSLEAEVSELATQTTSGGVRLARLPAEIQGVKTSLEKLVLEGRTSDAPAVPENSTVSESELLATRIQGQRVNLEALEAERLWLIERGPLHDALLDVARLRLKHVRDDLRVIESSLGEVLQEQLATSGEQVAQLEKALNASTSVAARVNIEVRLETARARRRTADYQRQLNSLQKEVYDQETLNSQVRQDTNRLVSLAEQYGSGEHTAQRLLLKFEHLRRERNRLTDNLVESLQSRFFPLPSRTPANPLDLLKTRLRDLNDTLFSVDDQLYEFERLANDKVKQLTAAHFSASPSELAGALATLRDNLESQRTALREQQQTLFDLTQSMSMLIALMQEHVRLLDEGYQLALSRMLWLKNGATLSWALVGGVPSHARSLALRVSDVISSDLAALWLHLKQRFRPWVLLVLLLGVLPWIVRRVWSRFKRVVQEGLTASIRQQELPRMGTAALLLVKSGLWPLYLAALVGSRQLFTMKADSDPAMTTALVMGLHLAAIVLAIGLFSRALFRSGGWAQQFWQLDDKESAFLRRTFVVGCLAGFLFLVPRQVVLAASPDNLLTEGGQTLERLLMLAFQGVIFGLVMRTGLPGSPLMARILARSRDQDGFLWRVWPFIYAGLLLALAGVMALNVLGYRYAARFIWLNGLETLSIILGSRLILLLLLVYGAQRLLGALYDPARRWHDSSRKQAADRSLSVIRFVSQILLYAIALLLILEIWGVSVWTLVSSQLGSQIMTRGFVALVTVGVVLVVFQGSNVLAEYILRPRLTEAGETRELGRKLRTLTPLVQTFLKVIVLFIAALVLLEQINIRTGPLLAGLGLFGIAIGLASQSLIKDIINGLFILFEDSISVGDIVTVRGIGGMVEKVTLRVVVLRDLSGNVHVIPNSTIDLVTNRTKVYSRYLLDVGVAYREDVDTVIDILKEVDEDMRNDAQYGGNMLEPIEILGLDRFGDSAVYVRARLKTRPGKQWQVGREFNRRMKKVFDERDIEIPFPHRTLYWGLPKQGFQPSIRLSMNDHDN